ncbi:MAG: J domain-containing protein [Thermoanaerobaculia bacterium]
MRLDEAYRTLDLSPDASDADVKRAWRDLSKVWHPDRFGNDPDLRRRAGEKIQSINEALERIRDARGEAGGAPPEREPERGAPGPSGEGGRPEPAAAEARRRSATNRTRALLSAGIAVFLLLRRPTPAGLAIALVLLGLAVLFVSRMRAAAREADASGLPGPRD